jgi:hypothetical protein
MHETNSDALDVMANDFRATDAELAMALVTETDIDTKAKRENLQSKWLTASFKGAFRKGESLRTTPLMGREPSFMRKLFTSTKSLVVPADEDIDDDIDDLLSAGSGDLTLTSEDKKQGEEVQKETKKGFFDPPMPNLGIAGDVDRMQKRNSKAEIGLNTLLSLVKREVQESLVVSKAIPVSKESDRVVVNDEISEYLELITTKKQVNESIKRNNMEIQKALNFRKSALILMNSNYSKVLVRKIEPIYINEARTLIKHK